MLFTGVFLSMRRLGVCGVIMALTACGGGGSSGKGDGSAVVSNTPPTADAGPDQRADEGTTVLLAGRGNDAQGAVTYAWEQLTGPVIALSSTASATPTFTAPSISAANIEIQLRLTVTDTVGAIAQDSVVITVNDTASVAGTWGAAQLLEEDDNTDGRDPRLATDANGNVTAVWCQGDDVWANRYTAGSGWGAATAIEDMPGRTEQPQVAVDAHGNAIAVWQQQQNSIRSVWASIYIADTGWSTPVLMETSDEEASTPQVAFDGSGTAHVLWLQGIGTVKSWTRRYNASTGWTSPEVFDAWVTQLAVNENGDAIAAGFTESGIAVAHYTTASGWDASSYLVTDHAKGTSDALAVALDNSGNAIVAWLVDTLDTTDIHANHFVVGSGWQGEALLDSQPGRAYAPSVAFDGSGNAMAIWYQDYYPFANRFVAANNSWEGAVPIGNSNSQYPPQLGVDQSGNALVVGVSESDNDPSIWASRFVPGQGWSTQTFVETNPGYVYQPRLVVDPAGRAMAVWPQYDVQYSIWANRLE